MERGEIMDVNGMRCYESGSSGISRQHTAVPGNGGRQAEFGELLQEKAKAGLNFSKTWEEAGAQESERGIAVDNQLMSELEQAVEDARKKGARDVAVIGRQGVFIVNVPNNTVVTTMGQQDMRERVFTNIDSAILL